ncbi:MAG: hypothetical protein ACRDRT_19030, partial [Pseudonocardiaceae bacterium]
RFLHLGSDLVQSGMRLARPDALEIAYTRCMMGFLLFNPAPRNILMIGLGGGSLAKFIYHHLSETRSVAVEINARVVAAARNFFSLPPEGERFRIVIADGAEYLTLHPESCDVLMVDGYEDGALPSVLASEAFYGVAAEALGRRGIMVANLLGRDRRLTTYLERMGKTFPGGLLQLEDGEDGNVVVFAFRKAPAKLATTTMRKRAAELERRCGLPFRRFLAELSQGD